MSRSRLQMSEIPLRIFHTATMVIRPKLGRRGVDIEVNSRKKLSLSPEEAYTIGSSLVEHATECGYDTGETRDVS